MDSFLILLRHAETQIGFLDHDRKLTKKGKSEGKRVAELLVNKSKSKYLILKNKFKKNEFIRPAGSDFKKGDKIIKKGQFINSNHILALKTLGIEKIFVKRKIKIVFYHTGNEI